MPVRRVLLRERGAIDEDQREGPSETPLPLEVLALVPGAPDPGEQPPFTAMLELDLAF